MPAFKGLIKDFDLIFVVVVAVLFFGMQISLLVGHIELKNSLENTFKKNNILYKG